MPDLAGKKIAYFGFSGLIDSNGVTRIAAALNLATNNGYDEVYLCLNSLGGYVGDGVFLYNHMRSLPVKIIAHNSGSVSSIAVAVFVGAAERYCSAHAMFMIHPTSMGPLQESMTWERLDAARAAALADDERTENILRERTSIPDNLLAARRVREVFITPEDALKFGLVLSISEFALPKGNEILQI
jgi:ATP-dependent Clp protease, protease subunit